MNTIIGAPPPARTPFLQPVASELQSVEELLNAEIRSDVKAAYSISGHTLQAGGKRLRPALVVLAARAASSHFPAKTVIASAAAAELIHMASLIHDDVVDGADERRGRPTANASFGNQISVLVGDYLLAKSIYLAAGEGNIDVIRVFSKVTIELSEGEVLQITSRGDLETTEDTYLTIIKKKTAGFIAGCCEIGAMLADASPSAVAALYQYGLNCGLAFQIADDLLDYVGDPHLTGKALDGDLKEGKLTLPLILALQSMAPSERAATQELLADPAQLDETAIQSIHASIERCGGYAVTRQRAMEYVVAAQAALQDLTPSPYVDALYAIAGYSLTRER